MKCKICLKEKRCLLTFPKNGKSISNKIKKFFIGSTEYICYNCLKNEVQE